MTKEKKDFRATPLTIGAAAVLFALVCGAVTLFIQADEWMGAAAQTKVDRHQERAVDAVHPGLPIQYVSRSELTDKLHVVDKQLTRIEAVQKQIEAVQKQILHSRRRHRRSP